VDKNECPFWFLVFTRPNNKSMKCLRGLTHIYCFLSFFCIYPLWKVNFFNQKRY
jgi:hypothetical protein